MLEERNIANRRSQDVVTAFRNALAGNESIRSEDDDLPLPDTVEGVVGFLQSVSATVPDSGVPSFNFSVNGTILIRWTTLKGYLDVVFIDDSMRAHLRTEAGLADIPPEKISETLLALAA